MVEVVTRIDRLEDALVRLAEAQSRTESRLEELAAAQVRTEVRLEELAAGQRNLAAAQARTEGQIELLAAAQTRTEARLEELVAAQARTEAALDRLAEAQARSEEQLGALRAWQTGDGGRRAGERFERETIRKAPILFQRGYGGSPEEASIRHRLTDMLDPFPDILLHNEGNPLLADLIWWKGERVAVVEVSIVVDEHDVERAWERADTLRRAGASALGVVMGKNWAVDGAEGRAHQYARAGSGAPLPPDDAQAMAERRWMAWMVGNDVSDGLIAFRRLPA
jgi:hypothetical protein